MIKTQIQFPDRLYRDLKRFAEEREMSLAEATRRGVEQLLARYPERPDAAWTLPEARPLGGDDFFARLDWRFHVNQPELVREAGAEYAPEKKKKRSA